MVSLFGLPMMKLGGLVLRTLTKPLAKVIKTRSKVHPALNEVCHELGQRQNRTLVKIDARFRRVYDYTVTELPRDEAVASGADLLGELLIFSVAVAVASYEYTRSSAKAKETKLANEREMEARFKSVERQVFWLERKLSEAGYVFDHDYPARAVDERPRSRLPRRENDPLRRFDEGPSEEEALRREYPFPWFTEPASEARAPSREFGFQRAGEAPAKPRKHRREPEFSATPLPLRDTVADFRKPQREFDFDLARFEEAANKSARRRERERESSFLPFGESLEDLTVPGRDYKFPRVGDPAREPKLQPQSLHHHHNSHSHHREQRFPQFGNTVSEAPVQQRERRFPRLGETLREVKMHHREHGFPRIGGIASVR